MTRAPGPASVGLVASPPPISYTNLRGVTFYLHAGTTETGKPRYFVAKTVGPGALTAVPAGFELTESINGVGSRPGHHQLSQSPGAG